MAARTAAGSYPGTSPGTGAPGGRPATLGGPGLCNGGGGPGWRRDGRRASRKRSERVFQSRVRPSQMNVTVSRFFQRTPPLEKKESRDDDGNDERFITTTKTQFCDEFSSAHARRVSEMMRVGVFFSPEKRLIERKKERKSVTKWQNQKTKKPKNSFFCRFFFFCIFS